MEMISAVQEAQKDNLRSFDDYMMSVLEAYLNRFEPSYYTKNGKDLLVYQYILLLSIQLLQAVLYLSKDMGDEAYNIDDVHMSIVFTYLGQYGTVYFRHDDLSMALEYYVQAAVAGGGQLSWTGRGSVNQRRQRILMLEQLLTEFLLHDGGIHLLLGPRGAIEGCWLVRQKIQKRLGAFSAALDMINKHLSEAICSLSRGVLDGETRITGLVPSGYEILETFKYYPEISLQERANVIKQHIVLSQLEAILSIHKLANRGNQWIASCLEGCYTSDNKLLGQQNRPPLRGAEAPKQYSNIVRGEYPK
ncbi:nuclear pore complex NUP93A-like [Olea europaea subsp. europaea]|uniref:Nuclear pore complex NUP93A-like n=1 Tax=Olea europaea subsp. europaea TaxID=158383 RepID=A0A8S0S4K5_OLEEU|nr:nuclear pore complex NUP93A-like [Olea europaea subsp. europaea]